MFPESGRLRNLENRTLELWFGRPFSSAGQCPRGGRHRTPRARFARLLVSEDVPPTRRALAWALAPFVIGFCILLIWKGTSNWRIALVLLISLLGISAAITGVWWLLRLSCIPKRRRRIVVDFTRRRASFHNFRLERAWRLPSRRIPELVVRFDDILGMEVARGGGYLTVSTLRGLLGGSPTLLSSALRCGRPAAEDRRP
jgi:hypothetical protein